MSGQPQSQKAAAEEVQLNLLQVSGEEQNNLNNEISGREAASCCPDSYYRKLAICSIICGLSCIGCKALIYSVKAEEATDPVNKTKFLKKAKKFGILSIVLLFLLLASIPILMALVSYLLTLQD